MNISSFFISEDILIKLSIFQLFLIKYFTSFCRKLSFTFFCFPFMRLKTLTYFHFSAYLSSSLANYYKILFVFFCPNYYYSRSKIPTDLQCSSVLFNVKRSEIH